MPRDFECHPYAKDGAYEVEFEVGANVIERWLIRKRGVKVIFERLLERYEEGEEAIIDMEEDI